MSFLRNYLLNVELLSYIFPYTRLSNIIASMAMQQAEQIWLKKVECPLCYEEFLTENIWQGKVSVIEEYPDLGKRYQVLIVLFSLGMPSCYYADFIE